MFWRMYPQIMVGFDILFSEEDWEEWRGEGLESRGLEFQYERTIREREHLCV